MRTHAGLPWKGPTTQLAAVMKVEAGPVQIAQRMEHERREVRRVGDPAGFAGEKRARLRDEFARIARPWGKCDAEETSNMTGP